ncbi:T9SS type A sorting domain-containing protein [Brumimicrobium oceani]|uniref:Secretion system C-terminal sorting domain-containing protein n=1 Tax=Brumimicrobium oceani TaxID=2100725 RepID=A0A2U2XCH4_9FLAO|nr:T9SS type A sorting domain-containing protein [Brumimicrobium oceani]PWH85495.1 hypothetical protein DIT68_09585 [Brumimicrobium oceani]
MKITTNTFSIFQAFKYFTLPFKLGGFSLLKICFSILGLALSFNFFGANILYAQSCSNYNPSAYANSQWLGHVYKHNGNGNPVTNPFNNYVGSYLESTIVFDRDWGGGSPGCASNDKFAVRYKMRANVACGLYKFTIGGDDGIRLSIDGGATWLVGIWSDHSYSTVTSQVVHLNGTVNFVLEYYEKNGQARVSFDYAGQTGSITAGTTQLSSNSGPINSIVNGSVINGSVGTGFNYQWQYSDDNGSSWTNISGQTSANLTTTAQGSVGTRQYRRETKCSGSVSYSAGASYTTVSPCASAVNMSCGTNYSATIGTSGGWNSYNGCGWLESGGEKVYTFTPSSSGSYTFSANATAGDPDFFLMSSCGPNGTNLNPGCWNSGNRTVNLVGGTTYYLIVDNYSNTNSASFTVSVSCYVPPLWQSEWVSMDTGSPDWCSGETRSITVTVKNIGSATWWNSGPDINIGVWWDSQSNASAIKTNANGLVSGATQTYTFSVTAPITLGNNRLIFDVINEGSFWFSDNNSGGGPGNVLYQSAPISIAQFGNPALFGDNVWNVYGYNGNNRDLSANDYRGFYEQPNLGNGDFGIDTEEFWKSASSPSYAGVSLNNGDLWKGCDVRDNVHTFVSKRKGFPCGNYKFEFENWDDETRLFIDGAKIWSCGVWNGAPGSYSNSINSQYSCHGSLTFTVNLDANSEVEFQTFEDYGDSDLKVVITQVQPTSLANNISAEKTCYVKGNDIIYFLDETNNELIAAINPNGNDLGLMNMRSFVEPPVLSVEACGYPGNTDYATATLGRHWVMSTQNAPITPVTLYLPFRDSEYNDLVNVANGNPNPEDNILTNSDLKLTKYSGPNENNVFSDNCGNGNVLLQSHIGVGSVSSVLPTISNSSYAAFSVNSFSEFWLHGQSNNSALPVELTNLSARCEENTVINWTTASELNSDYFLVEKSRDGQNWILVAEQNAAGNSNDFINYSLIDSKPWSGVSYYRLRQVDLDGREEVFGPISVSCEGNENSMKIYPNPNNGNFTVEILSSENYPNTQMLLTDMTGKIISSRQVDISAGTNQFMVGDLALSKGAYLLSLLGANAVLKPLKVVVY